MSLSRKDYVAIAAVLAEARPHWRAAADHIADQLADVFERDNANFDRERFVAATKEHDHG